jgi:large subunit ribosomal protein L1
MAKGKKYDDALGRFDPITLYAPLDALELVKALAYARFDETVEAAYNLGIDARQADQAMRGTVALPKGTGREVRILVFATGDKAREAEAAGADIVGGEDLAARISGGGSLDFDLAIATPDLMSEVGKLGRILGPRGLMPNPRTNTVVEAEDLPKAIRDAKQGRVEFRTDRTNLVHVPLGKVSFDESALLDNLNALVAAIMREKPPGAKGQYLRTMTLTTTMGPGIKLDIPATVALSGSATV